MERCSCSRPCTTPTRCGSPSRWTAMGEAAQARGRDGEVARREPEREVRPAKYDDTYRKELLGAAAGEGEAGKPLPEPEEDEGGEVVDLMALCGVGRAHAEEEEPEVAIALERLCEPPRIPSGSATRRRRPSRSAASARASSRSSSSSATTRGGSTTTSVSSARRARELGRAEGRSRSSLASGTWPCTSRIIRSTTGPSRARSRRASTAPARSRSGTPAPTSWSRTSATAG